jgi:predicted Zn finger-like uncharacterized protein
MPTFECATCKARYRVADDQSNKAVRCRRCGEWGRVNSPNASAKPADNASTKPMPETSKPEPPRDDSLKALEANVQPWFYSFLMTCCEAGLGLAVIVAVIGVAIGLAVGGSQGWPVGLLIAGSSLVSAAGTFFWASLVMPLLDIGVSLRMIRVGTKAGEPGPVSR